MFYAPEKGKLKLNNLILNMTVEIGKYCRIFRAQSRGNPHQPTSLYCFPGRLNLVSIFLFLYD